MSGVEETVSTQSTDRERFPRETIEAGAGFPPARHAEQALLRFVVVGAGAVGGYLGGRLVQSGQSVAFLVRQTRKDQLDKNGLKIRSPLGDADLWVTAETDADAIGDCDVVVVAVKNFDLDSVLGSIARLSGGRAKVVSVLNGVEHLDKISSVVGRGAIVGGPLQIEATLGRDGEIVHKSVVPSLALGSLVGMPEAAGPVAEAFRAAGVKADVSPSLLADFWKKNVFITAFSGITTLARAPIGTVMTDETAARVVEEMVTELVEIAWLVEPELRSLSPDDVMRRIRGMPPTMTSSMHQDLEKGLPLEVESIQGYMVRKGREKGVKAPALETCYATLRLLNAHPSIG